MRGKRLGKRLLSFILVLAFMLALLPTIAQADTYRGDANADGKVNAADALVIEQVDANPYLENDIPGLTTDAGDANGDGKLSIADATAIKAYLTDPETYLIVGRPPLPDDGKADGDSGDFTLDLGGTKRVQVGTTFTVDVTFKLGDKSVPVVAADIQFVIDDALTVEKYDFSNSVLGHDKYGYGNNRISPQKDLIVATDRGHADPVPSAVDGSNLFTIVMNVPEGTPTGTYTVDIADRCQVFKNNLGEYYSVSVAPLTVVVKSPKTLDADPSALSFSYNTETAQTVWYAGRDWRVIGYDGEGVASSEGTATLLPTGNVGFVYFNENNDEDNTYGNSDLKKAIENDVNAAFSDAEQAAIAPRDLLSGSYNEYEDADCVAGETVEGALLWPLSTKEALALDGSIRRLAPDERDWAIDYWWLRSPGRDSDAAYVEGDGNVYALGFDPGWNDIGVRPAFHLDLDSVLFVSPAEGGKADSVGDLTAVEDYTGSSWKLTLLDESRSDFTAVCDHRNGTIWSIHYGGAKTGENEYISAVIKNAAGEVTYYGKIREAEAGDDNYLIIDVAGKISDGDTLYVFNEQVNGDKATDYASELQEITPPFVPTLTADRSILYTDFNTAFSQVVWYGGSAWYVIGVDGQGVAGQVGVLTLLSKEGVGTTYFSEANGQDTYADSLLKEKIDATAASFSSAEQNLIVPRTLVSGTYEGADTDCLKGEPVENAPLWPLSTKEAFGLDGTVRAINPALYWWGIFWWWLRSPGTDNKIAIVQANGGILVEGKETNIDYNAEFAIRPAFWLQPDSILFVSAAEGGKAGTVGQLSAIENYRDRAWRLTLLDESRGDFSAAAVGVKNGVWTIEYNGAKAGEDEYISAVIVNAADEITYYGKLGEAAEGKNTVTVNVAGKLQDGDKLYVFSEQDNGDNATDYASALLEIAPPVETPTFTLTAGHYLGVQTVAIACATADAEIRYTTNGTEPSLTNGTKYVAPITVDSAETIRARAFKDGMSPSFMAEAAYEISFEVGITAGEHMTATGDATQTVKAGDAITAVVYTADEGYCFPEDYAVEAVNGITVTRDSETQITVSGTPTDSAAIILPAATEMPITLGDADGDGVVTMKDVLLTRKFIAKLNVTINEAAADVNRDGSVDMKDVLLIRKFVAGLIESF